MVELYSKNNSELLCHSIQTCVDNKFVKCQIFAFEHKINKSNAKVSTDYSIIDLYSEDICYDIFVANKFFDFFWNVFNTQAINVCYTLLSFTYNETQ